MSLPPPPRRAYNNYSNRGSNRQGGPGDQGGQSGGGSNLGATSTVLFVGLVPFEWDDKIMRSVVCGSGKVVDVRLGYDHGGKNKGFCFVEYQTPADAQYGKSLLGQVKITMNNRVKNLRIEESKEGLRAGGPSQMKPLLQLDRSYLPPNVQIPEEMLRNTPGNYNAPMNQYNPQMAPNMSPNMQQNQMNQPAMHQPPQPQPQPPMPQMQQQVSSQIQQGMSNQIQARNLPQPPVLPFTAPDKINENLSHIAPAMLIELLPQLKATINTPDEPYATGIFQQNPALATATDQALLLMGLIDDEVISESSNPTNPPPNVNQTMPQTMPQNTMNMNQPSNHSTPQISNQYMNQPPINNNWSYLPHHTQQKLSQLPPDQADLIAQVLTISPDQIPSLEPEKQQMVNNLRAQYL